MSKRDKTAKTKAEIGTMYWLNIGNTLIPTTIARAAPKPALADTPSVYGLASGLFRIVCIPAPAIPSAAPTAIAIIAVGRRNVHTMVILSGSAVGKPKMELTVSVIVKLDGPTSTSMITLTRQARAPAKSRTYFRRASLL